MSEYYAKSGTPSTSSQGASAAIRGEFTLIEAGFDKLPTLSGNGGLAVRVNASGTALEATSTLSITSLNLSGALTVNGNTALGDATTDTVTIGGGTVLLGEAANILALRNGANAQALRIYNTTDAGVTNYERLNIYFSSNVARITSVAAGTGTARSIIIGGESSAVSVILRTNQAVNGWAINTSGHLTAESDNVLDIGASGATRPRTGYFGTSVIVDGGGTRNSLQLAGAAAAGSPSIVAAGNDTNVGLLISSKGTSSIAFQTNNTAQTQFNVAHTASAVNFLTATGAPTTAKPSLLVQGSDTNIGIEYSTKGTGAHNFITNNTSANIQFSVAHTASAANYIQVSGGATGVTSPTLSVQGSDTNVTLVLRSRGNGPVSFDTNEPTPVTQVQVLHTASATRTLTLTGSNGGNPTISTSAGNLAITPTVVLASGSLVFTSATCGIIPGATSFALRNNADSVNNLLMSDAGLATVRAGVTLTAGALTFGAAASKIVPGATSLSLRNNADNADNILIADTGAVTLRSTINGLTISTTTGTFTLTNGKTLSVSNSLTLAGTDSTTITFPSSSASMAALNLEDQALTGGVIVTSKSLGTISSGTVTPDPGDRPQQHYTNGGAHTLAPSSNVGSILVDITNNASAGAITTSGFTKVTGDAFTTTNGNKFRCHISVGDAGSLLSVQAMQ